MREANWETREVELHFSNVYEAYGTLLRAVDENNPRLLRNYCRSVNNFGLTVTQLAKVDWDYVISANRED